MFDPQTQPQHEATDADVHTQGDIETELTDMGFAPVKAVAGAAFMAGQPVVTVNFVLDAIKAILDAEEAPDAN